VPFGDSPPLHVHQNQDEVFQILDGEIRFVVGGKEFRHGAGAIVLAPKGVPHSYRVESKQGGHFIITTVGGDFERFVRAMSRPAERPTLPDPSGPPSPEAIEALTATAAQHGIHFVGPPLS
jgi:uncharacterized RmlC-like cupin family protein